LLGLTTVDGGALNHPENVVYRSEQALASYLIAYRL